MERLIDANVLREALNDAQVEFDEFYKGLGKAKSIVDEMPTVGMSIAIHGHWKVIDSDLGYEELQCSECGHERFITDDIEVRPVFCEHCGTKMSSEVENNG